MILDYTIDISLTSEDRDFLKEWCEKYKMTEQVLCERAITSYIEYLRDCDEFLSIDRVPLLPTPMEVKTSRLKSEDE